jgi:hypothetical protein
VRKTATYEAFIRQYGVAVANGQMLAYFWLITLTAVLAMVLGGEIVIQIGGEQFESAAPLIPLTAAAMSMPALYRSVSQYARYPNKRRNFVVATVLVAISYIGFMLLLLSGTDLGIYSAPIAMLAAFLIPMTVMFMRSQLSSRAIEFPYFAMSLATVVAAAIGVGFHFVHPAGEWQKLPVIAALMVVWLASLFLLRIIPRYHWDPIRHITSSALRRRSALKFDPEAALGSLEGGDRGALRTAVVDRLPATSLAPSGAGGGGGAGRGPGGRRWRARPAGRHRGSAAGSPAPGGGEVRRPRDRGAQRARWRHLAVPVLRRAGRRSAAEDEAAPGRRRGRARAAGARGPAR